MGQQSRQTHIGQQAESGAEIAANIQQAAGKVPTAHLGVLLTDEQGAG
jgi:hypothetical protein